MESDGFWHLRLKDAGMQRGKNHTPTKAWLKENVDYARLDEELWILLQNRAWRLRLRDYIVEHQLTRDGAKVRFVAEGLGILVALVLTA
ncbi:MAG: hypothetical protein IKN29_05680 [Bacteroidales bacterium]|nr:hypothetical protein [Bacteroidales bacterium]